MLEKNLFESERILVRPFIKEDIMPFLAYRQDKDVERYQGWKDYSLKDAQEFVEWAMSSTVGSGKTQLALVLKESNTMIGDIYLCFEETHINLGYTCASEHQKKGYMSEILSVVLSQLLDTYKRCIRTEIDVRNIDSIRLCERLGFKLIKVVDGDVLMERCEI